MGARQQFQVPNRKTIQPHVAILVDAGDGGNVFEFFVLGAFQVMQSSSSGDLPQLHVFYSKTFKVLNLKMFEQFFTGIICGKHPFVEGIEVKFFTKTAFELFAAVFGKNDFGGIEAL